jgi:DNA-binding MarR family transcriptional regulator
MTVNDKLGIQPREISHHMPLSTSRVKRLVEKMEYRGFLKRNQVGRATEVYPTKLSQELNPKIKEAWKNLYTRYAGMLGESEVKNLTHMINEANDKLE